MMFSKIPSVTTMNDIHNIVVNKINNSNNLKLRTCYKLHEAITMPIAVLYEVYNDIGIYYSVVIQNKSL